MKFKQFFSIVFILLVLTGCATVEPLQYPTFSQGVSIHVSKDMVSTWTETAAGDAVLPDSQVLVAKQGGGLSAFGLLGVAADRSAAKKRSSSADQSINQYFDQVVADLIRSNERSKAQSIKLIDSVEGATFKLLPIVRFATDKSKRSLLEFRLTTRYFIDGKAKTKNYHYAPVDNNHPLDGADGWFGEGKKFEKAKASGFDKLVTAFLDDIGGQIPVVDVDNMQRVKWRFAWMKKDGEALLIKQYGDFSVVSPLFGERPIINNYFVVENSKLGM